MRKTVLIGLTILTLSGCAATPLREAVTSFRSFEIPLSVAPGRLVEDVKAAMSTRASNLMATTGVVPNSLPEKAGDFEIRVKQMSLPLGQSLSWPQVECAGPYSLITNNGGFSGGGSSQSDAFTACIYPYQKGTRVHIVLVSTTSHQSGIAGLVNASVKGMMVGDNREAAERSLDKISESLLSRTPSAKVIRSSKQ